MSAEYSGRGWTHATEEICERRLYGPRSDRGNRIDPATSTPHEPGTTVCRMLNKNNNNYNNVLYLCTRRLLALRAAHVQYYGV